MVNGKGWKQLKWTRCDSYGKSMGDFVTSDLLGFQKPQARNTHHLNRWSIIYFYFSRVTFLTLLNLLVGWHLLWAPPLRPAHFLHPPHCVDFTTDARQFHERNKRNKRNNTRNEIAESRRTMRMFTISFAAYHSTLFRMWRVCEAYIRLLRDGSANGVRI